MTGRLRCVSSGVRGRSRSTPKNTRSLRAVVYCIVRRAAGRRALHAARGNFPARKAARRFPPFGVLWQHSSRAWLVAFFPTGRFNQAKLVARYQLDRNCAAMEVPFPERPLRAHSTLIGQPNDARAADRQSSSRLPGMLSFLAFGRVPHDRPRDSRSSLPISGRNNIEAPLLRVFTSWSGSARMLDRRLANTRNAVCLRAGQPDAESADSPGRLMLRHSRSRTSRTNRRGLDHDRASAASRGSSMGLLLRHPRTYGPRARSSIPGSALFN
jgi:hypothetical protein